MVNYVFRYCVFANTGSSKRFAKIWLVKYQIINGKAVICEITPIDIDYSPISENASYEEKGICVSEQISAYLEREDINITTIFFRCPALVRNIQDLTLLNEAMENDIRPLSGQKLGRGIKIKHGSEAAFWIACYLKKALGVPAVFSCGIPTDKLIRHAKITGIKGLEIQMLSHFEAIYGSGMLVAEKLNISFEEVEAVIIMLGSGVGIYGLSHGEVCAANIRHLGIGPLSESSMGAIDTENFLRWCEEDLHMTTLKEAREYQAAYSGSKGGFQDHNALWNSIQALQLAVLNNEPEAKEKYDAFIFQVVRVVGAAMFSMSDVASPKPLVFFGGGSKNKELVDEILEKINHFFPQVFNFGDDSDPEQDPEMKYMVYSQLALFLETGLAEEYQAV